MAAAAKFTIMVKSLSVAPMKGMQEIALTHCDNNLHVLASSYLSCTSVAMYYNHDIAIP
jgi:hypothetical protein